MEPELREAFKDLTTKIEAIAGEQTRITTRLVGYPGEQSGGLIGDVDKLGQCMRQQKADVRDIKTECGRRQTLYEAAEKTVLKSERKSELHSELGNKWWMWAIGTAIAIILASISFYGVYFM